MKKVDKNTNPVYEKNLANMKLLVSCVEFQKIVKEMREHLKMPPDGFSGKDSDAEFKEWHKNWLAESSKARNSKSFLEQEKRIWEKFNLKEITRKMFNKQMGLLNEKVPVIYLAARISFILDKFRLPLNYREHIGLYIFFNSISAPFHNFIIGPYQSYDRPGKVRYVPITVFGKLYRKEMEHLKKEIDLCDEDLPKYRPVKDIDKKLEIEEWYENKNRLDEGTGDFYMTNNSEIAEAALNNNKEGKKVYDIWRGVKTLKQKRFGVGKKQ